MTEKKFKLGFKIKLSEETSEKLTQSEVKPNITSKVEPPQNSKEISTSDDLKSKPKPDPPKPIVLESILDTESIADAPEPVNVNPSTDNYAEHIHYEDNIAIYTDPSNKQEYVWCNTSNQWVVRTEYTKSDDAVKYGHDGDKHTYTDKDGSIYFWDEEKNAWFPKVDDDFLAHYQMSYGFVDNTSDTKVEKKEVVEEKAAVKRKPEDPKWFDLAEDQNTKVYVSNLPLDITEEEFVDIMQKCGLVMKDPSSQRMKIKLYTKPNSQQLKGDALCTYIRVESVDLALNILDGYVVRDHKMKVQRAQFQMKGDFNPALKPKKKRRKDKEKLKKMQERLFDWRPEKMRGERSKHERIVIIKNLFEPALFDNEVHLILEYQQDMREECSKCGEVKKVTLYDRHPEGVAQVVMKEPEEAEAVVQLINGRWFGKRQLSAHIWDGKTKYKMEETDADLNKRLDGWNKFLGDEDEDGKKDKTEDVGKNNEELKDDEHEYLEKDELDDEDEPEDDCKKNDKSNEDVDD